MDTVYIEAIGKVVLVLCLSIIGAIGGMIIGAIALPIRFLEGTDLFSVDDLNPTNQTTDPERDQI